MKDAKTNFKDLTFESQEEALARLHEPPFRVKQIRKWLYQKQCCDINLMTDLSKPLREKLSAKFGAEGLDTVRRLESKDGTVKYLFGLSDGMTVETVYIPDGKRGTVCVSTQVGCKLACLFCETGRQKFGRDLTIGEILNQVIEAKKDPGTGEVTNVVFMGMGEPMDNLENVMESIRILNSKEGFHIGKRRITVSTAGVLPGIRRLADAGLDVNLAISLHAVDDAVRSRLMPINMKYPVNELIKACANFPLKSQRLITLEVILFDGVNDSPADATKLIKAIKGLGAKVNLMKFNPVSSGELKPSGNDKIEYFMERLSQARIPATVRTSRGADIEAACGQLKSSHLQAK